MDDLDNIFTHHSPTDGQVKRFEGLRSKALELAQLIDASCPESREKSLAITNLQSVMMWANAAIAIHE